MLRCIQSCHSGKCNDGIGWSLFLRRFKKAFLVVILHDLREQPLRFTKPGNLLGVALPLCFLLSIKFGNMGTLLELQVQTRL